jgi:hypothetical protein
MNSKIHINLTQGILEVEGDADFVRSIYDDFKSKMPLKPSIPAITGVQSMVNVEKPLLTTSNSNKERAASKSSTATKKKVNSKTPTLNKNLNLFKEGDKPSLKDFMSGYKAKTDMARNLLFVHYLREIKGLENIGVDEIYTCYKNMGLKIPKDIQQSLLNTAFSKGWLDTASLSNITITVAGENAVTLELPASQEDAA